MILGKDHRVPPVTCLNCKAVNDGATCVGEEDGTPSPGSISVCGECGHIMIYDTDMTLRELTDKEMIDIAGDPRIITIQKIRILYQKKSGAAIITIPDTKIRKNKGA
jgi:hypothetical protein